jgi:hypothetical protein
VAGACGGRLVWAHPPLELSSPGTVAVKYFKRVALDVDRGAGAAPCATAVWFGSSSWDAGQLGVWRAERGGCNNVLLGQRMFRSFYGPSDEALEER